MPIDAVMKDYVIDMLKEKIPSNYYYHNFEHTVSVLENSIEIAQHEHCTEKEQRLVATAALWHDVGFVKTYNGHEEVGCQMAKEYLKQHGYSKKDISAVCGMIMATKNPQSPTNKLEEIVADADMSYLGTTTAAETAEKLYHELLSIHPALTKFEWLQVQIKFLQHHHFFTSYCQTFKDPKKAVYLENLLEGTEHL